MVLLEYLLCERNTSENQVMGKPRLDTGQIISTGLTSNGVWKITWDGTAQGQGLKSSKQRNGQHFLN